MNLVPRSKSGLILFYKVRLEKWAERAEQIGTTSDAVDDLVAKTEAARAAYTQQQIALQTARSATLRLDNALEELATAGSSIIRQIRGRAGVAGDSIYSLALIRPPDEPAPAEAPGKPQDLTVSLCVTGELMLNWTCDNPRGTSGTIYQVWRRVGPGGRFEYIGASGKKKFNDDTLPAGASFVTYQIRAFRSTKAGPPTQFNVQFGGVNREMTNAVVTDEPPTQWGPLAA